MATANLPWTNNATGDSPDSTKIERVKDLAFDHSKATVEELANGSGGGLDPTSPTGSYADGTVSPYSHYSYRVSTVKGTESSASIATPLEYVYDQDNELGYPNGSPSVTPTYNCSVEPIIHLDFSRLGGFDYQDESVWSGTSFENRHFAKTWPISLNGAFRHNTVDAYFAHASGNAPCIAYGQFNGNPQKGIAKIQKSGAADDNGNVKGVGNNAKVKLGVDEKFGIKDGVTVFLVGAQRNAAWAGLTGPNPQPLNALGAPGVSKAFGTNVSGNVAIDGVYYGGSTNGTGSGASVTYPSTSGIISYRHNNTLAAFNSAGGTGAQLFVNGSEFSNTGNNNHKSYHQGGTANYSTHMGAFAMQSPAYGILLLDVNYVDQVFYEYIVFPEILNAADMNAVTGYLCTRYGESFSTVAPADLI